MEPQVFQGSQALLETMGYLVFQARRDPRGCLASWVFQEREENLVRMDTLAERENMERRVGLASWETED